MRLPVLALLLAAFWSCIAQAQDAAVLSVLARLAEPGVHAIMRHALAPGVSDPEGFQPGDCATQRNLDERGRAQAQRAGAVLRAAGVRFDHVLSSRWCRCLDTAELLAVGPVEEAPALDSLFVAPERRAVQTAEIRDFLAALPPEETALLVTHQVNISALVGRGALPGELIVFSLGPTGGVHVLGRVGFPIR